MVSSGFDRSLAIVIGINDYRNGISPLQSARADAEAIATLLETQYQYQVIQLTDTTDVKPTLENIRQLLQKLPTLVNPAEATRLLFYFAGHGIALNGEEGPEGYLIPQNAQLGNVQTYLPMTEVHNALLELSCRHFLGILDCCFAGAFRWSSTRKLIPVELGTIYKERFDRFVQDPAWQVITSAASDQTALDAFALKDDRGQIGSHSPFAAALIHALSGEADAYPPAEPHRPAGDGIITATELYLYLRDRVEHPTEAHAVRQTPGIFPLKKHDKGEFVFLVPGRDPNLPPAPPLDRTNNPYRGLEPFEEHHHDIFFGRKALTQQLYQFVIPHPFTVVLGASGSGKSSLVKAGLLPKMRNSADQNQWAILPPFRPGESPFRSLNTVLASVNVAAIVPAADAGSVTPAQQLAAWFQDHPDTHLLFVVDQFEELITLCHDEQERRQFLDALQAAMAAYPDRFHVLITLRSDFEPQFRGTVLEPYWSNARFIVPAMMREELREAIEEPASARVLYFDPHELVEQLIDEVANMPGALPLLSFALSELYLKYLERQEAAELRGNMIDRAITQADYEAVGGVTRSLTQRADQEYETLIQKDPGYSQTIRNVMLRMIAIGDELTRRRVLLSELRYAEPENIKVETVIESFLDTRLLTGGVNHDGQAYVEPSHDTLVRGWQRLLAWKKEEQETLILQRGLTPAVTEWQRQPETRYLWHSNPRLDLLEQVLRSSTNWFNQAEDEFVTRSLQQRRKIKRIRWGLVALAFVTLSSFTAFILLQLIQTDLREKSARVENLIQDDPLTGVLLAIETIGQNRSKLPWGILAPVESSLLKAVQSSRERNRFTQQTGSGQAYFIDEVAISPNGKMIALNTSGGGIYLRSLEGQQIVQLSQDSMESFTSISFGADGKTIIASDSMDSGRIKFWDVSGQVRPLPFKQTPTSFITAATFTSDGRRIITGDSNGQLRIWDTRGNPLTETFGTQGARIAAISISPDGTTIASSNEAGTIQLWTSEGKSLGELPKTPEKYNLIRSIQFSSDGKKILIHNGNGDGCSVFLWIYLANQWIGSVLEQTDVPGSGTYTTSAVFTPDGEGVVTGHTDGHVRLWRFNQQRDGSPGRKLIYEFLPTHSGDISGMVLTSDGKKLITTSVDGVVKVWDLKSEHAVEELLLGEPGKDVNSIISPDGRGIVRSEVIKQEVVTQFWNFESLEMQKTGEPIKQPLHKYNFNLSSFNADRQQVLLRSAEGDIRVWDSLANARSVLINIGTGQAALSPDGQRIVTGDSSLKLWKLNGQRLNEIPLDPIPGASSNITHLIFNSDGSQIATVNTPEVCLWQLRNDTLTKQLCKQIAEPSAIAFSPDGRFLGIGNKRGVLYLWDLNNNQLLPGLQIHSSPVNAIAFSPDGKKIVSGDDNGSIQLSTTQTTHIGELNSLQSFHSITSLAFSPDGNAVISSSFDGAVRRHSIRWQDWLTVECDRLRHHPLLENPTTDEQRGARDTCRKYVWSHE
jgi:WD40 repeat protein